MSFTGHCNGMTCLFPPRNSSRWRAGFFLRAWSKGSFLFLKNEMIIVCEQEWGDFDNIGCITSKRCCKEVCPVLILKNGSWWICLFGHANSYWRKWWNVECLFMRLDGITHISWDQVNWWIKPSQWHGFSQKVLASALDQNMKHVLPFSGLQEFVHTRGCFSMIKKKPNKKLGGFFLPCSPDQCEA